ncbi:MAG: addiction module protein [Opitutaceae bacterium]|nr:addiction module protein [Opitutaceae bacterium]
MNIALPLQSMTVAEKLEVMEVIWADLSRDETNLASPAWHEQVLRERQAAVTEGREVPLDWETAKRRLRDLRA